MCDHNMEEEAKEEEQSCTAPDIEGKSEQEIRLKIDELRANLPIAEPTARRRPPKPKYNSVAHTFREIFRDKIDLTEFKKKHGELDVPRGDAKKKRQVVHPYMMTPEYERAQREYDEYMVQYRSERLEYKETSPNAYQRWTEMRRINKLENLINPVIQEERRKKEQMRRLQMDKEENEQTFKRRSNKLRFVPDDVLREMVLMERDVSAVLFSVQEEMLRQVHEIQRRSSDRFQRGYDTIVNVYKQGLME